MAKRYVKAFKTKYKSTYLVITKLPKKNEYNAHLIRYSKKNNKEKGSILLHNFLLKRAKEKEIENTLAR